MFDTILKEYLHGFLIKDFFKHKEDQTSAESFVRIITFPIQLMTSY